MKIAVVSNYYPPNARGGAEIVAARIADELSDRGHSIFVLTRETYKGFPFNISNHDRLPFFLKLVWHMVDLCNPFSDQVIRRVIREEKPDVFLTHNLKGIGLNLSRAIQRQNVFQIHTLHDLQLSVPSGLLIYGEERSFLNQSFLRRWYERAVSIAIGKPNVIVSPSKFLIDLYRERGLFRDATVCILPNPAPETEIVAESLFVKDETKKHIRLFFGGQLETHKGIVFLLNALEALDIPFELHIAGNGSLRSVIEQQCTSDKRFVYHGFLSTDEIIKQIALSDVVIVPSLCYENSPTMMYESFAVGVPVIASRIGGIPELITEGENGYLFEPGNTDQFVDILKRAADRSFDREAIRQRAEKYALKSYVDELEKMMQKKTRS